MNHQEKSLYALELVRAYWGRRFPVCFKENGESVRRFVGSVSYGIVLPVAVVPTVAVSIVAVRVVIVVVVVVVVA